jgi:transcriptional regulator with XRE-family HTH domain
MLRDTAGLSQGQLAAAMSVSRQTINSIETGRYTPSLPLVAGWAGGDLGFGVFGLGLMTALGAVFLLGSGRSETLSGLGGPGRDERWEAIDMRATAGAGLVLIAVVIGAWLWEIGHGRDGSPYSQLGAIAGITYVVAVAILRWRN